MGLLDDAIREHLELLRRRGADPTEIARAEAEALSPAVREVSEPEAADEDGDLTAGTEPLPAPEPEIFDDEELDDELEDDSILDQPTGHFDVLADEDDLAAEEVALEDGDLDDPALRSAEASVEDEIEDELELEPLPEPGPPAEIEGQEALLTEEPADTGDGDVLEGTPDFLEDSPDHDKLWFEQSGPRDFDFDGDDKQ